MSNCYSYLNQIFYTPKKFDHNWEWFDAYMLNKENLETFCSISSNPLVKEIEQVKTIEDVQPNQKDSLFWCIYILFHGVVHYQTIQNKHKNTEMDEKQSILKFIIENATMIKEHAKTNKLKLSQVRLKEIQSELLLDKTTSFYVFYILAIYYKRNIIIKMDEVYMHFLANECEKDTYLITRNQGKYNIQMQCLKEEDKEHIMQSCIQIPFDKEKPLKGVSTYKVSELEKLAFTLKLDIENKKKPEIYQMIVSKITELQN
tara:strand:+ start:662 stop:1438 length:777 start_codon:yes stop_codon:yes gene_type:complete